MKQWTQRALITATVLTFAGVLAYHAGGRVLKRPTFEAHSVILSESSPETKGITAKTAARVRVAHLLIAGRLSLLQAAAAFRDLDERWPCTPIMSAYFPHGASEDEIHCLHVIRYVGTVAPPDRAAELTGRFHAELDDMLQNGRLRLPDSDGAPSSCGG